MDIQYGMIFILGGLRAAFIHHTAFPYENAIQRAISKKRVTGYIGSIAI